MKIGIIGAGQLGRMLALAGTPLGQDFVFLDPATDACAAALGEHRLIAQAIVAGDEELAGLLMRRHIAAARKSLEASMGGEEGSDQANNAYRDSEAGKL